MVKRLPEFVLTKTPLRISFAGGGTDIKNYYELNGGAFLSTTVDKFIYISVKKHGKIFGEEYRLNYAKTEIVNSVEKIKNDIARECIKLVSPPTPLYISTIADVHGSSGLGSSSSFAIGFLKALHALKGENVNSAQLVEEAVNIEVNILKRPIGKQDHLAAAFGGLNFFKIDKKGGVIIEPHSSKKSKIEYIFENSLLFWTGISRNSSKILNKQKKNLNENFVNLDFLKNQAFSLNRMLKNNISLMDLGKLLSEGWEQKKKLATEISGSQINTWYKKAIKMGALGGKLCGAGGGGFLFFIVPKKKQIKVRNALKEIECIDINYEPSGVSLLYSK